MALIIELKPGERFILGNCVVTNGSQRTRLTVEGDAPLLREKDILTAETADTPAKRVYLSVQLMYLAQDITKLQSEFFDLVRDLVEAAPSTTPFLRRIGNHILMGEMYKALREAKALIAYEQELVENARVGGTGL